MNSLFVYVQLKYTLKHFIIVKHRESAFFFLSWIQCSCIVVDAELLLPMLKIHNWLKIYVLPITY